MSAFTRSRRLTCLGWGALGLLGIGVVALQPMPAAARVLSDRNVPAYVPAPYFPHTYAAYYGYSRYDDYGSSGRSAHPWH